jgi:nucleoside-diphosphate-sugar epimerase
MRAVIFGGSGFLGTHLTKALTERGVEVLIADRVEPSSLPAGVRFERSDVREKIRITREQPFDAVYNLAAIHRTPGHEPSEYYETNVGGARNVTEWCEAGGERYVYFTSSIAIYGRTESATTEGAPPRPQSDYGKSKLEAEQVHRLWLDGEVTRRLVVSRPAAIFGPGEGGNFTRLAGALRAGRFMYPGGPDVVKACGYVEDFVSAVEFVESMPDRELTYNFAYPDPYTIRDVCDAFHRVSGLPLPRSIPTPLVRASVRTLASGALGSRGVALSERIKKLRSATYAVPHELMDRGFTWKTDLDSGIRAWFDAPPQGRYV